MEGASIDNMFEMHMDFVDLNMPCKIFIWGLAAPLFECKS